MAVSLKESSKILIDGDYYYLIEIPSNSSNVVLRSTEDLKEIVNMQPLADQLHSLGSFIRVAYASVVGHSDLQIRVRKVYHKVAELCDQSLLAATKFQQSSTSAVDFLQTTYEYFMEGHFKAGLRTLKHVHKIAKKLESEAKALEKQCRTDAEEVLNIEGDTIKKQDEIKASNKKQQDLEQQLKIQQESKGWIEKDLQESKEKYYKADQNFEEQLKKQVERHESLGLLKTLANAVTRKVTGEDAYGSGHVVRQFKEERDKHERIIEEKRKEQKDVLEKIAEFAKDIQNCGATGKHLEGTAVAALDQALIALGSIANTYAAFKIYWSEIMIACEAILEKQTEIQDDVESDSDDFQELLNDKTFRKRAIKYYGTWIGLNTISKEFKREIQVTQKEVRCQLAECPSEDEAKLIVKDLAKSLQASTLERIQKLKDT